MSAKIKQPDTAFSGTATRRPRFVALPHLKWVKTLPCMVCGAPGADPHHIKPACPWADKPAAGTMRPDDCWVVPLCRSCHDALHQHGDERRWWYTMFDSAGWMNGVTRTCMIALALYAASGDDERGCRIVSR